VAIPFPRPDLPAAATESVALVREAFTLLVTTKRMMGTKLLGDALVAAERARERLADGLAGVDRLLSDLRELVNDDGADG